MLGSTVEGGVGGEYWISVVQSVNGTMGERVGGLWNARHAQKQMQKVWASYARELGVGEGGRMGRTISGQGRETGCSHMHRRREASDRGKGGGRWDA